MNPESVPRILSTMLPPIRHRIVLFFLILFCASVSAQSVPDPDQGLDRLLQKAKLSRPADTRDVYGGVQRLTTKLKTNPLDEGLLDQLILAARNCSDPSLKEALVTCCSLGSALQGSPERIRQGTEFLKKSSSGYLPYLDTRHYLGDCSACSGSGMLAAPCSACGGGSTCRQCLGKGYVERMNGGHPCKNCAGLQACRVCRGSGRVRSETKGRRGVYRACHGCDRTLQSGDGKCGPCQGSGRGEAPCPACQGSKKIFRSEKVAAFFPILVDHCSRLAELRLSQL